MAEYAFLFTDIQGSTQLWERHPGEMQGALARHDSILREAAQAHGGHVFRTIGDAFCVAFGTVDGALRAAVEAQQGLAREPWPAPVPIRSRMALYAGEAEARDGDYFGQALNRVARLRDAGHGGQILVPDSLRRAFLETQTTAPEIRFLDRGFHRLKDVVEPERLFQVAAPGLEEEFPPLKTLSTHPHNLPAETTALVGREREIREVRARMERAEVRLLTLVGPPGAGKTRLALAAAAALLERYPDGIWWVDLSAVESVERVLPAIARACGMSESPEKTAWQVLTERFAEADSLLLLDNFERVEEAADDVASLLRACRRLQVLVTSRAVLELSMEHQYDVPPLSLTESRTLFLARVRQFLPEFEPRGPEAAQVEAVCRELEGVPLAVELAAAQLRLRSLAEIVDGLRQRLELLATRMRDLPPRHRSLRAAIDWSYGLLAPAERHLLRALSVFAGGFVADAAVAVCEGSPAAVADGLDMLRTHSLIRFVSREGAGRYTQLESVRLYGRERLEEAGEEPAARRRHRAWCRNLVERASASFGGPGQEEALDRLDEEHDNLRAALDGCLRAPEAVDEGLAMATALRYFWELHGYFREGLSRLEALLSAAQGVGAEVAAGGYRAAGKLAWYQSEFQRAEDLHRRSLALYEGLGETRAQAGVHSDLGDVAYARGDLERAYRLHASSLETQRAAQDRRGIVVETTALGNIQYSRGDLSGARAFYQESLQIARELGDRRAEGNALNNLGLVARAEGDLAAAQVLYESSRSLWQTLNEPRGVAIAANNLGTVALCLGESERARRLYREGLELFLELGDLRSAAYTLAGLGSAAVAEGRWQAASRFLGASARLRDEIGAPLPPANVAEFEGHVARVRAALGEAAFRAAWEEGQRAPREALAALAAPDNDPV